MIRIFGARILLLAFSLKLLLTLSLDAAVPAVSTLDSTNSAPNIAPLKPGPDAGRIAFVTAELLEQLHYLRHPLDDEQAGEFLDEYLNALDPQHVHFLQSDLADFAAYRTNLDKLTLTRKGVADTSPAYAIFSRFTDRLKQRVAYTDELLKNEKFEFKSDDRMEANRHDAPYPADLNEAKKLWRQRLRYEYLMEKLALEQAPKTNAAPAEAKSKTEPAKSTDEQIVEKLQRVNHRVLHMFQDWDNDDVLTWYLNSLAHTYDPHSDYQGPMQYEDFAINMNLALFGIGAELHLSEDGYCTINQLLNGPALKSKKVKVGDRIIAVGQSNQPPVDIVDMPLNKAVRLIRGPKGSEVRLTLLPAGAANPAQREIVSLIRDEIRLDNGEAKGKIIEMPGARSNLRLGVIDLPSFYATIDNRDHPQPKSTSADVAKLLKKFTDEKVGGVILDLRRNGGGSLEEAIRLAGLFIRKGPIVQIKDSAGGVMIEEDPDSSVQYDGPLIVLTSRGSASASEIVAAALQDYGRALIVGDVSTFGKGSAQRLYPLRAVLDPHAVPSDPGTLKITNSKFYRASGASTELKGVIPDIVLPSRSNEATDFGENSLPHHLPWDTIPSASYEKLNRVQPYLGELLKHSSERTATNRDFAYIREDIDQDRQLRAEKTVSLNEKKQLKDIQEADARKKTREKERLARPDSKDKIYEITLKDADVPGLPKPLQKTNTNITVSVAGDKTTISTPAPSLDPETPGPDLDEEPTTEDGWQRKAAMDETEHILMDYIALEKEKPMLSAH